AEAAKDRRVAFVGNEKLCEKKELELACPWWNSGDRLRREKKVFSARSCCPFVENLIKSKVHVSEVALRFGEWPYLFFAPGYEESGGK
ncbi:MAG: hypothetical protein ACR2PH_13335, partial [Desulfobulbia bacterium]